MGGIVATQKKQAVPTETKQAVATEKKQAVLTEKKQAVPTEKKQPLGGREIMAEDEPVQITVIGAGRMGCSIGGELARRGAKVAFFDKTDFNRIRAIESLKAQLQEHQGNGLLTDADVRSVLSRVRIAETLENSVEGATLVVEAIYEDLGAKRELFLELSQAPTLNPRAVLTSTTMSLTIDSIAQGLQNPCCGMRFLFPVFFIDEVEVSARTGSPEVMRRAQAICSSLRFTTFVNNDLQPHLRRRLNDGEVGRAVEAQRTKLINGERGAVPENPDSASDTVAMAARAALICNICMDKAADALILPCGHMETCMECAKQCMSSSRQCPTCRAPIEKLLARNLSGEAQSPK